MSSKEYYITTLRNNSDYIKSEYGVNSMSLFGSVARNEQKDGSDVDLYVDMPPKILLLSGLKIYLEKIFGCPVDVLRKRKSMNPYLKESIEKDATIIF